MVSSTHARLVAAALLLTIAGLTSCGETSSATDTAESSETTTAVDTTSAAALTVSEGWTRQPAQTQTVAAVYATVSNPTDADVRVVSASSPLTDRAELHETVTGDGGAMSMREAVEGFVVPAGGELIFEPGGAHIMLIDIDPAAYPVDRVEVTLAFDTAPTVTFEAAVEAIGASTDEPMDDHDDMAMDHDDDAAMDHDHDEMATDPEGPPLDDPLDPEWLHELDDELAFGTIEPDRQRDVLAPFITHYQSMDAAPGSPEAALLQTLDELDAALAAGALDEAAPLATVAHEALHELVGHG